MSKNFNTKNIRKAILAGVTTWSEFVLLIRGGRYA